jgi:hypothetical protein
MNFTVAKVGGGSSNFSYVLDQITKGYQYLVDNVVCNDTLVFSNYSNTSCFCQNGWVGVIKRKAPSDPEAVDIRPRKTYSGPYYDFFRLYIRNIALYWNKLSNCKGLILSDFNDTHFMTHSVRDWRWFGGSFSNRWYLPMFSVNKSIGDYLIRNNDTANVSGFIDQEYRQQTNTTPGVISHNVVA